MSGRRRGGGGGVGDGDGGLGDDRVDDDDDDVTCDDHRRLPRGWQHGHEGRSMSSRRRSVCGLGQGTREGPVGESDNTVCMGRMSGDADAVDDWESVCATMCTGTTAIGRPSAHIR